MSKWRNIAVWIGLSMVSLIFIQAGAMKLMGVQKMADIFNALGYPKWFLIMIGIMEIIAAIMLLIRRYSRYGAAILASIMIGAIASVLGAGWPGEAVMPAILLCILVWIAVARKPASRKEAKNETMIS